MALFRLERKPAFSINLSFTEPGAWCESSKSSWKVTASRSVAGAPLCVCSVCGGVEDLVCSGGKERKACQGGRERRGSYSHKLTAAEWGAVSFRLSLRLKSIAVKRNEENWTQAPSLSPSLTLCLYPLHKHKHTLMPFPSSFLSPFSPSFIIVTQPYLQ